MEVQAVKNFRANVRRAMERKSITVRAMAQLIGTKHPYIINMLKDDGPVPSLDRCEQVAAVVGVQLPTLLKTPKVEQPAA